MKIRELLSDETKWCQDAPARDLGGCEVIPDSEDAVCWCIGGAFDVCYRGQGDAMGAAWYKIQKAIGSLFHKWNDAPERTFKEVKELVDRLDV